MHKTIVGMADSYGTAERIVEDLELAGIVGGQVEVVSGADEEVTRVSDSSEKPQHPGFMDKIRNLFRTHDSEKGKAHDYYVEDPEFWASHIRAGRALVIVRMPDVPEADRAVEILRAYGALDPRGGKEPRVTFQDECPEHVPPANGGKPQQTMGDDVLTTGGTRDDLEGHGTKIRTP